jgi:RHS repeat-associated protein
LYDALGSVKALSDSTGAVTDTYNYSAFGKDLSHTGTTANAYKFAGEQFDSALDNYYLRARYYNQSVGRFTQMDTWNGNSQDPITLHKYLYANVDPVNRIDPSGMFSLYEGSAITNIIGIFATATNLALTDYFLNSNAPSRLTHHYKYDTEICEISNPRCTKQRVFEGLLLFPAPFTSNVGPVHSGDKNNLCFGGYLCQPIVHEVHASQFLVVNKTLPGHIFWDGHVDRSVVTKGNELAIVSEGSGYNTTLFRFFLNHGAAGAFNIADWNIADYVNNGGQ